MATYKTNFSFYTNQPIEAILALFNTDIKKGLSSAQVRLNQKNYGTNSLPLKQIQWWHILWNQCSSIFVLIFISLGLLSLILEEFTNALIIGTCVSINVLFGFYQEYSTSKIISLLKKYLVSYVKVRRNNENITVSSKDIVVGDLIILATGDRLFADVRIIQDNNLTIDESVLTGESTPTHKTTLTANQEITDIYQAHTIGFTGTTVTSGTGIGVAFAVGKNSTLGAIIEPVMTTPHESGIIQSTHYLGFFLIKLIIITLCCVLGAHFLIKGTKNYIDLVIFATALAISVIPEALPIVVTFCLSSGAAALAKKNVLVKRLSAIEDLGTIEILCTDKTGTLTENKATLVNTYTVESYDVLLEAALASDFVDKSRHKGAASKGFDAAILNSLTPETVDRVNTYERIKELSYDPERKLNSVLIRDQNAQLKLIVRGMQEDVIPLCTSLDQHSIKAWIEQESNQGHRITAIAIRPISADEQHITDLRPYEQDLLFIGMLAFYDPLKKTTIHALKKSKKLGLQIKVLSGDSVAVCYSIGQQIGLLSHQNEVITGAQFTSLNEDKQLQILSDHAIFARCLPSHKLHIIQLLQRHYTVAYLGDGINDIPALKAAHVSLAVQEAVDMTRDIADIILLEKSLLVIIDGIAEGRKIIINILKYIKITLSNNLGNLYAIAIVSLFVDYFPILPIHILLINLLSDFPLLAISIDAVDSTALRKPQHFSTNHIITFVLVMGLISNIFDVITFIIFHHMPTQTMQMAWYTENMLTEILLIFSLRTTSIFFKAPRPSTPLIVLSLIALFLAIAPFYTTLGRKLLILPPLSTIHLLWIIGIATAYFVTVEIAKYLYYSVINKLQRTKNSKKITT